MKTLTVAGIVGEIFRDCEDPQVMALARQNIEEFFHGEVDWEEIECETPKRRVKRRRVKIKC